MKKNENVEVVQDEVVNENIVAEENIEKEDAEEVVAEVQETPKKTTKSKKVSLDDRIAEWKKQFGRLYKTEIDGDTYIWRRLSRREYVNIVTEEEDPNNNKDVAYYDRQDRLCKMTVLYPDNIEQVIADVAGVSSILADEIMYKSGFSDIIPKTQEI